MRLKRLHFLIVLLAALVFFQNVMASVRVCTMPLAVQNHVGLAPIGVEGHGSGDPCSKGGGAPNCFSHLGPISNGDSQAVSPMATVTSVAPLQFLYRVDQPSIPARLDIGTSSARTTPSTTLLFGNLRL